MSLPEEPHNFPTAQDLADCLLQDVPGLRRRMQGLRRRQQRNQPISEGLAKLWQDLESSRRIRRLRQAQVPEEISYPPELPVIERKEEIARAIERHPVVILCGETGSGKSTQLPKLCLELGRGIAGRIGHTQPRRIAARSLASRIAQELGTELGTLVGYRVRFHDRVRPETAIKLMTDGMLLAEIQGDRWLQEYDTLIIDEAHERSLNIDFLLGYLRGLLPKRPDLRLIITSATIDPQRFAQHFADAQGKPAPILEISGRTYPVELRYRPPEEENAGERDPSMQQAISQAVKELASAVPGDLLVFLSGEREIRETAETLRKQHPPSTEILPLYARQSREEQAKIFQPHGTRRVVLATNVAETSLTVPGIQGVIDPGFARISRYSHRTRVQRLPVERISQAAANQRKGRCGRVAAGICIRLYSEDNFNARAPFTEPEIQRTNLAAVILQMKALGFGEIETFPFVDPPERRLIADGYRTLVELAALDGQNRLTPLGRQLARLPVDPRLGRMLLAAAETGCLREVTIIAAALSIQDPRERPLDQQQAADEIHASFHHEDSDFLALLKLWDFLAEERRHRSKNQFRKLCRRHFLSYNRVLEWQDLHIQLRAQLATLGFRENEQPASYESIHQALLRGLLSHIGCRGENGEYEGARGSRFFIHPSSGLFQKKPKWIIAAERVETNRTYGRLVARVQPDWIERAGAHLLQRTYSEPHWQARSGQVAAFERVRLFGLTLVAKRRVNYGPINPTESREIFLQSALTEGDFHSRAPFWRHNRELIEYVQYLEAKSRRRDLLVSEEQIYAFYAARVPEGIYAKPQFERWLRQATRKHRRILHMELGDLLRPEAQGIDQQAFPDHLQVGATALPLEYHFNPGHVADGLTLVVPLPLLHQVSSARCEWLVPGLLQERILALLRGLPKQIRKQLVPLPDRAARLANQLRPGDRPLIQALREGIQAQTGLQISESLWDETAVPPHLRMKFRLVDGQGKTLALSEDLNALKHRFGSGARATFSQLPSGQELERENLRRWDFGDLPEHIELEQGGIRMRGYPSLIDQGDRVALRILDAPERAEQALRAGLRRLFLLRLGKSGLRNLRNQFPALEKLRLYYAKAPARSGKPKDLEEELIALLLDRAFLSAGLVRTQAAFEARWAEGAPRLPALAEEVYQLAQEILRHYHAVRQRLAPLNQPRWRPSTQDVAQQLDGLIFRGFLEEIPYARLQQYPRYLRAVEMRLEKLPLNAARDRKLLETLRPLLDRWQERAEAARQADRPDPRLEEIRWMLEELRVSFFAQSLGTAYPVSCKRIEARWRELGL